MVHEACTHMNQSAVSIPDGDAVCLRTSPLMYGRGDRKIGQILRAKFCDPPYRAACNFAIPPHFDELKFCGPPHPRYAMCVL